MTDTKIERIKKGINDHQDFPKPGVVFRDIFPVLRDPALFKDLIDMMIETARATCPDVDVIVGLDARGFLFGPIMAQAMNISFVPVRKKGKLPGETFQVSYSLEYGENVQEIQKESIKEGQKVLIVDDLLATGGTMRTACELVEKAKGEVVNCLVVIELTDLNGRSKLTKPCTSLIKY